jgi:O-antigen/teichoic acid export membrane protein
MLWNLMGMGLPTLVGVLVVPVMLHRLGDVRFGIVSIAWVLVGYLGVLDLGLSRALTREIAEMRGRGTTPDALTGLARRATSVMLLVGCGWALILAALAPGLGGSWLSVPWELRTEARNGFLLAGLGAPALLYTNAKLGWLEGLERYGTSNAFRIPTSSLTMLAPMLISLVTPRLDWVLGGMLAVRLLAAGSLALFLPYRRQAEGHGADSVSLRSLWRFSGWLTVTNVIGPMLVYSDRFYIGVALSAAAVAHYTVPYDVVVRLTSLPLAVLSVLFPRMTVLLNEDMAVLRSVVGKAGRLMVWAWAPALLAVSLLGSEILGLWVGESFLGDSLSVWRWLAIGVFLNGMGFIPYFLIQSAGRSDVTARFHLAEVPLFAIALVVFVGAFGIIGAACAWTLRVGVDTGLLYVAAWRMTPAVRRGLMQSGLATVGWSAIMLFATLGGSANTRWVAAIGACLMGAAALMALWRKNLREQA